MPLLKYLLPLIFIHITVHLSGGLVYPQTGDSPGTHSEKYFIEDQNVLLYKTVNWWYDCLPEDEFLLCHRNIRCKNDGNARIEETSSVLRLSIRGGFGDQLSIFRPCETCPGPAYLRCIRQNETYLGKGKADSTNSLNRFTFRYIDPHHVRMLKEIEKEIVFLVQGRILGLTHEGKIALHNTGLFLKKCPVGIPDGPPLRLPIVVTIKRNSTDEIIAQYMAVWPDEQR